MCGIAGIFKFNNSVTPDDMSRIKQMMKAMPWRGPDAYGLWSSERVAFGHMRLSIIDLNERANQPMHDSAGRTIIFNGEIYNYIELKKELRNHYNFKTESDTEVILASYDAWGTDCVKHFNGEWAFAIFDPKVKRLFISRDRFGIKPLYYYYNKSQIVFGSEVRTVIAGGAPHEIQKSSLMEFIKYKKNEPPYNTLIKDIKPVRPGTSLILEYNGKVSDDIYYGQADLFNADVPRSFDDAIDAFGELFSNAVKLRLRSDVPIGFCLSGGLDSSAVTAVAIRDGASDVNTYSAIFPGTEANEERFSSLVAKKLQTKHHTFEPTLEDFFDNFDNVIVALDSPHGSPKVVARYLLLKMMSGDVKVILEGQGGDEIFGGYEACYRIYREEYEKRFNKKLLMRTPEKTRQSKIAKLKELHSHFKAENAKVGRSIDRLVPKHDSYTNRQYHILRNNLLTLLHTGDRLQMIHSLEGRVPFLDHRLVEFCISAPVGYKMQEYDKFLVRSWIKKHDILPPTVLFRTDKKGFATPYDVSLREDPRAYIWFRENLTELLHKMPDVFDNSVVFELLEEQKNHGIDNVNRLLAVMSVLLYFRRNKLSLID